MRILGIDPGPTDTAWVLWNGGEIEGHGKVRNEEITRAFFLDAAVDLVAIEMIASYGMSVGAEVFETCVWIGRFMERARGAPVRRVFRMAVKMHLCHSSRAKDSNIRQALIDKLGAPGKKSAPGPTFGISGDCWAALGVAITAAETPPG